MTVYVVFYRDRHDDRTQLIGVYDSEEKAESAAEDSIRRDDIDFRRISVMSMEMNRTYI